MTALGIINIIAYLTKLVALGVEVAGIVRAGQAALNIMIDENRDPTDVELDAIRDRIVARGRAIQDA